MRVQLTASLTRHTTRLPVVLPYHVYSSSQTKYHPIPFPFPSPGQQRFNGLPTVTQRALTLPKICRSLVLSDIPMMFLFRSVVSLLTVVHTLAVVLPEGRSTTETEQSTVVNLRIEGATDAIFEGMINTKPHNVTTPSGTPSFWINLPSYAELFCYTVFFVTHIPP